MHEAPARASDLRRRARTRRIVAVALGMVLLGLAALVQSEWQLSPPVRRLAGRAAYRGTKADLAHARARALLRGTNPGPSPVLITEVSAENRDVILDDDLAPSDWIELYNRSDRPVPLAGWRLAEAGRPHRGWVFPTITLPGRSYVVVWLSGKNRVGSAAGRRVNTRSPSSGTSRAMTTTGVRPRSWSFCSHCSTPIRHSGRRTCDTRSG
jgi:Lamin Tail Domain